MTLLESMQNDQFSIVVEFTPRNAAKAKQIAEVAKEMPRLNEKYRHQRVAFVGVSLTQNPGGNLTLDHQATISVLRENGFPQDLEVVPHVSGKDMNRDALAGLLNGLLERGVRTLLALTGDAPHGAKGVFDVDSLGLLQMVRDINLGALRKSKTAEEFASAPLLEAGAAVSPYKYTEGSLAMQCIKASKKVREGAAFLTCQSGWDAERSELLVQELGSLSVPILGNALVVNYAAAKVMQTLPGCVITDGFLDRLQGEAPDDALTRAGQQLAMFRGLGYAGIDLGKPGDFDSAEQLERIVDTALEISDWRQFKANITFAPPQSTAPLVKKKTASISRTVHHSAFDRAGPLHGVVKRMLAPFESSAQKEAALYRLFNSLEAAGKRVHYECQHCGDCFLPENEYVCSLGGCGKGLPNPPCGDADARGYCGVNADRICVGERIYYRLLSRQALEEFKAITLPPRKPELRNTSSVLNYFFHRDHAAQDNPLAESGFIQIGEMMHASIPFPGAAMKYVQGLGPGGLERPNRGLAAVEELIRSQVRQGAVSLDINLDALNAPNAPELMRGLVRVVHRVGKGVPPCVDSSDPQVLMAGLKEWFSLGPELAPPVINSIPFVEMDKFGPVFELRAQHRFRAICLLVGAEGPLKSTDAMVEAAHEMFARATEAGFRPDELFFDTVTLGITTDGSVDATGMVKPSHTHNAFHAIRRIREDPNMKGVHALLGVSNWGFGAKKRRVGHIRAFAQVAQQYGLDAVIADVSKRLGMRQAPPELVELVEMFVSLDGSEDSMSTYLAKIKQARQAGHI